MLRFSKRSGADVAGPMGKPYCGGAIWLPLPLLFHACGGCEGGCAVGKPRSLAIELKAMGIFKPDCVGGGAMR